MNEGGGPISAEQNNTGQSCEKYKSIWAQRVHRSITLEKSAHTRLLVVVSVTSSGRWPIKSSLDDSPAESLLEQFARFWAVPTVSRTAFTQTDVRLDSQCRPIRRKQRKVFRTREREPRKKQRSRRMSRRLRQWSVLTRQRFNPPHISSTVSTVTRDGIA